MSLLRVSALRTLYILIVAFAACLARSRGTTTWKVHITLLKYAAVRDDLGIRLAVGKRLDWILATWDQSSSAFIKKMHGKKFTRPSTLSFLRIMHDGEKKALALLTRRQTMRLRQISLQYWGASDLENPVTAKSVGLTKGQVSKLNHFEVKQLTKMFSGWPKDPTAKAVQLATTGKARQVNMEEYARQLLTRTQWKAWLRLQGRPFPFLKEIK